MWNIKIKFNYMYITFSGMFIHIILIFYNLLITIQHTNTLNITRNSTWKKFFRINFSFQIWHLIIRIRICMINSTTAKYRQV